MNRNAVCWFEIYVQNLDRARKFYETVFQVKLEKLNSPGIDMLGFPMVKGGGGAPGALVKYEQFPSGGNSTLVYFSCDDCAVEEARVKSAGGRVQKSKMAIGEYGFISLIFDSEGNIIGLHSLK
jgi:predicted enzyme related to lactoylglutathione lyase